MTQPNQPYDGSRFQDSGGWHPANFPHHTDPAARPVDNRPPTGPHDGRVRQGIDYQQHQFGAVPMYAQPVYLQPAPTNGAGVAGFVCGLLGLLFLWVPYAGLILGLLGVILSGVGISNSKRTHAGSGLAVAGLVLGIIAVGIFVILVAAVASVVT